MTRRIALLASALALAVGALVTVHAQSPAGASLRVLPVRGNIYVITGAGGNVVASIGKDGVLLVDAGSPQMTDTLLATVRELDRRITASPMAARSCVGVVQGCTWWSSANFLETTSGPPRPKPIIGIINTSIDADHIGGHEKLSAAGRTFGVRNLTNTVIGAWIVAHENVSTRLSPNGAPTVPAAALPNETYYGDEKKLNYVNGEGVVITHVDAGHTDGDSMVFFRGSDVIAAGDVFNMATYPVIDTARGGTIQGTVDALNKLLDMAIVEHMMEGGTMIVPGHGRLADTADLAYYRDMVTIMRDRVREMRKRGMTLDQIKAARLTKDYDPRFGKNPSWTPAMFIEAIYGSLGPKT
jgi:glyoxylase-like metal-dependent hydrolase (beta-lactamase superfamily II)